MRQSSQQPKLQRSYYSGSVKWKQTQGEVEPVLLNIAPSETSRRAWATFAVLPQQETSCSGRTYNRKWGEVVLKTTTWCGELIGDGGRIEQGQ